MCSRQDSNVSRGVSPSRLRLVCREGLRGRERSQLRDLGLLDWARMWRRFFSWPSTSDHEGSSTGHDSSRFFSFFLLFSSREEVTSLRYGISWLLSFGSKDSLRGGW